MTADQQDQIRQWVETACVWEATAPKPGNVHPAASFIDLTFDDFVAAARAAAPHLAGAAKRGVGRAVLEAVESTRKVCGSNVNLGICLLIAPLAAVPMDQTLSEGIAPVLAGLTEADARDAYEAIRRAQPGGLGAAPKQDVSAAPTLGLIEAMRLAEERDRIAWNYVHRFEDVVTTGPAILNHWIEHDALDRDTIIVALALELMAVTPDTLIARKCGGETAREASLRARDVLKSDWPDSSAGAQRIREFDAWLRSDDHRRNPGTTADIVAATLFAALRDHPQIAQRLAN